MNLGKVNAIALKLPYIRRNNCTCESYENFIVMGDFNIDVTNKGIEFDKLDEFCDLLTDLLTN